MPSRNLEGDYRYVYQGQEKDPETGKEAFELRLWDSRIGRWLTTDPYRQYSSPYLGMGNDPINGIDPDGGYRTKVGAFFAWVGGGFKGSINNHDNPATIFHKYSIETTSEGENGEITFNSNFGNIADKLRSTGGSVNNQGAWVFRDYAKAHEPNFFGRIENKINNDDFGFVGSKVTSLAYNTVDDLYAFGTHFELFSSNGPRHLNGSGIVRGSSEGIDTGINGLLTLATLGRLKQPALNGGQFIGQVNKIPVLGKEIIKNSVLRGKLNRIHNFFLRNVGKQVVAPNIKTGKSIAETGSELIQN